MLWVIINGGINPNTPGNYQPGNNQPGNFPENNPNNNSPFNNQPMWGQYNEERRRQYNGPRSFQWFMDNVYPKHNLDETKKTLRMWGFTLKVDLNPDGADGYEIARRINEGTMIREELSSRQNHSARSQLLYILYTYCPQAFEQDNNPQAFGQQGPNSQGFVQDNYPAHNLGQNGGYYQNSPIYQNNGNQVGHPVGLPNPNATPLGVDPIPNNLPNPQVHKIQGLINRRY